MRNKKLIRIIAIVLAVLLVGGVVVGALLYAGGNGELALNTLLFHEDAGLVSGIANSSHACILVFVTLLGTLVVLMNRSGGAAAFGRTAKRFAASKSASSGFRTKPLSGISPSPRQRAAESSNALYSICCASGFPSGFTARG